jgi:hypothetical protein
VTAHYARRYVLDIELDDRGIEEFDELMFAYAANFSRNFDLSIGPSPEDANYPHPLSGTHTDHPQQQPQGDNG